MPPYWPADPGRVSAALDSLDLGGPITRCRLVDARLRTRRGDLVGWALWRAAIVGVPDEMVVVHADGTIRRFTDDPALPTLASRVAAAGGRASVVRYQPGKSCTLHERASSAFRKCLADGRAPTIAARGAALWHAGAADPRLRVARPLGADPSGDSYRTEIVRGRPLAEMVGERDHARTARSTAALVAALHTVTLATDRAITLDDEVREARKKVGKIGESLPGAQRLIAAISRDLDGAERASGPAAPCLVHGDLNVGQFLVDDRGPVLLDLDSLAFGDPECDLAEIVVDLVAGARDVTAARAFCDLVLTAYAEHAGRSPDPARLLAHASAELLARAWRHHRRGTPGWSAALMHELAAWPRIADVLAADRSG